MRPFVERDIAQVAALHGSILVGAGSVGTRMPAYRRYFQEMFLEPARHTALNSLVYERQGEIRGFLGIHPRKLRFRGQPILAAVCSQFVVHPSERGLAGLQMLKACFGGPQDLSIADEAGDNTRKMWEWCGGAVLLPFSTHWVRPLRLARTSLALARRHTGHQWLRVMTPLATIVDAALTLRTAGRASHPAARGSRAPLDVNVVLTAIAQVAAGRAIVPEYDAQSLEWLFERLSAGDDADPVRKQVVRDDRGDVIGWFVYAVDGHRIAEVLQVAARVGTARLLLDHLAEDARLHGVVALTGRLDSAFTPELSEQHSFLYRRGHWMLAHTPHVELMQVLQRGDAFLSRLEGERCLRFNA